MQSLVAMSAAYGAGGSRVGPELARRLEVPFVDRGISMAVAERLSIPLDQAMAEEERRPPSLLERLLAGFTGGDSTGVPVGPAPDLLSAEDFHRASVQVIREQAESAHGVILGRGAVAALRADARVLRVRLTGQPEDRIRFAMLLGGADETTARTAQRRLDAAHEEYLRRFYGISVEDPSLYHLVLDVPTLGEQTATEIILLAVRALAEEGVTEPERG